MNNRGSIHLEGVELENMGQHDSENAGIHITYTNIVQDVMETSVVKGSSIHDCNGYCMFAYYSNQVIVDNSVFYKAYNFLIQALETK